MDVSIRIDGVLLDGITGNSVKLNINNPDPFTLSDPTVSYTASVEVPRSENNDRVFRADRWPWLYNRTQPYVADLIFGGMAAPRGLTAYRAQVVVNENSYTVTLVESFTKLADIPAPVIAKPYDENALLYWTNNYDSALAYAYNGNISRPALFNFGNVRVYPAYVAEKRETLASSIIDSASQCVYRTGHNYLLGARYPSSDMIILDGATACALERMTGSSFTLSFTQDCFVWLPEGTPTTVYLGSNRSTRYIALTRSTVLVNGNYKYRIALSSSIVIQPLLNNPTFFHIRTTTAPASTKLTPATNMPTGEGYFFSFTVIAAGTGDYSKQLGTDTGFTSAFDLVQAYCKAFFWTYNFIPNPFNITLLPLVNSSTIDVYRQNWTGKIDMSSVKISEPEGLARTYRCVAGDASCITGGSVRAMRTQGQGIESSLPIGFGQPPFATMVHLTSGSPYKDSFFLSASGYRAMADAHYERFAPGWQVTAKMRLSYFDIKHMTSDGLYYIDELHSWFYLRSIQSWSAGDSTANVTLIAVNN